MKLRIITFALAAVICTAAPARSQWVVTDPGVLAEAVTLVTGVTQQYQLWLKMATGLGANIQQYRIPGLDAPLLVLRELGPMPTLPALDEQALGALGPQTANLTATDTRLTATLQRIERLQQFSQALTSRIAQLQADVTAPGKSMAAIQETQTAAQWIAIQQMERANAREEAAFDLALQQELRMRAAEAAALKFRADQLAAAPMTVGADTLVQRQWWK